jgi:hypothetical protein
MASLQRINSNNLMAKVLVAVWLMAAVASSQQRTVDEANSLKPNSWIIQSPVKKPLPGLSGIGLPPGGVLLMTMDPNATMTDLQPQQQQQQELESATTAVTSVSLTEETTVEPSSATELSSVSQSSITSAEADEVAVTDTLSISTGGTVAITEESNSPTLELATVTQQSLSNEIESSSSDPTPTTEPVTDAAGVVSLVNQDFGNLSIMEALKVDSESDQTNDESVEQTTVAKVEEQTTDSSIELSTEFSSPVPWIIGYGESDFSTDKYGTTEESQTEGLLVDNHVNVSGDAYPGETVLTTENSLNNEETTTEESRITENIILHFGNNFSYLNYPTGFLPAETVLTTEDSLSNEETTTEESGTTEIVNTIIHTILIFGNDSFSFLNYPTGALPSDAYLATTTDSTTDAVFEEENVTVGDGTTLAEESSTEYSTSPIPPKGPAPLPEVAADDESDLSPTEQDLTTKTTTEATTENILKDEDDDAVTDVILTGGPSVLLGSLTLSGSSPESDETSTEAESAAVLSTEANDESNVQSGSGANPDNDPYAPLDVVADDSGSVNLDVTIISANLGTESPAASDVTETEAQQQFLVFTTEATPEDPGLAESVTEIENIELSLKNKPESSNLVASASATIIKNAGNSRNLLSEENVKEEVDVTKVIEEVVAVDTKSGEEEEARQYSRPYPIRHGMRPRIRPSIDRHDQNFRPEYDDYNFNIISRTYDYCYTYWCKFKKTLSRIGLL